MDRETAILSSFVATAAKALLEGIGVIQPARLIVVGGAGSLEVAPGVQLVDTPDFLAGVEESCISGSGCSGRVSHGSF